MEPQLAPVSNFGPCVLLFTCLGRRHASFQRFSNLQQDLPHGRSSPLKSGHTDWQGIPALGTSASLNAEQKGRAVAARTIPFPNPPGTAATSRVTPTPPPPPPTGAAKLIQTPRRYRGLHLVPGGQLRKGSHPLNRLAQTQAIVAQVEREVAQRALRERDGASLTLLSPINPSQPSLATRAAHRVVLSLFPAGL